MTHSEDDIKRLIRRSSLGSKEARELRATVSHEHAERVQNAAQAVGDRDARNSAPKLTDEAKIPRSAEFIDRLERRARKIVRGNQRDDEIYSFIDSQDTTWLGKIALAPAPDDRRFAATLKRCKRMSVEEEAAWTELARRVRQSDLERAKRGDDEARRMVFKEAVLIVEPVFVKALDWEDAEIPLAIFQWKFPEFFDRDFDPFMDFRHFAEDFGELVYKSVINRRRFTF